MSEKKSIELNPDKKHHFWWYLLGVLLTPLLGIGIYLIYKKMSGLSAIRYKITNHSISAVDSRFSEKIDLVKIRNIDINQRWIDKKFDLGTLLIRTETKTFRMIGMKTPTRLADMILNAAEAERLRLKELNKKTRPEQVPQPGRIDRMDYLTGLWQQGLITDEEFKNERKHFEP